MCDELKEEVLMKTFRNVVEGFKKAGLIVSKSVFEIKDGKTHIIIEADSEYR